MFRQTENRQFFQFFSLIFGHTAGWFLLATKMCLFLIFFQEYAKGEPIFIEGEQNKYKRKLKNQSQTRRFQLQLHTHSNYEATLAQLVLPPPRLADSHSLHSSVAITSWFVVSCRLMLPKTRALSSNGRCKNTGSSNTETSLY
jgi:hypothetical protein